MSVYFTGPFPDSAHQKNVPCARCYAPRSAKMMIPGRISCPSRWTKEYSGMLGVSVTTLHWYQNALKSNASKFGLQIILRFFYFLYYWWTVNHCKLSSVIYYDHNLVPRTRNFGPKERQNEKIRELRVKNSSLCSVFWANYIASGRVLARLCPRSSSWPLFLLHELFG